jgi:hypothetical protein
MVVATIKYGSLLHLNHAFEQTAQVQATSGAAGSLTFGGIQCDGHDTWERYKTDTLLPDALWSVTVRWARRAC